MSQKAYTIHEAPSAIYDDTESSLNLQKAVLKKKRLSEHRGEWSKETEFILSCISMSVGLGNIWRFPYVAYENGGGAFLIPYLIVLCIIGRPLYYMEMTIGQFSGEGPIRAWKRLPAFKGVGFAQVTSTAYLVVFYNYLMAVTLYYLFVSFSNPLPWTICDPDWGIQCQNTVVNTLNTTFNQAPIINRSFSELYYRKSVLNVSSGLGEVTWISWKLTLCLALSMIIIYLSLSKGVKLLGKIAYFTALFPYVVLITLLVVTLFNDGAVDGIIYFFKPQWGKLKDAAVWYTAIEQAFFSLGVSFGSIIMYSSYNRFHSNVNRDALIISVIDTFTSVLAGSVIFAVLGSMAFKLNKPIETVISSGEGGQAGLAFIAYPEALSSFKFLPQLWSALFFMMLFTLGLGSTLANIETILSSFKDEFIILHKYKEQSAFIACFIYFLFGLPLVTDAGIYMLKLLDAYAVGSAVFFYAIVENVGLMWIFGCKKFCEDLEFMLKRRVSWFWRISWTYVTPTILIVIFIYGNYTIFISTKENILPQWGTGIIILLATIAIGQIPFWMMVTFVRSEGSWKQKFINSFTAKPDSGPKDPLIFKEYKKWQTQRRQSEQVEKYNINII